MTTRSVHTACISGAATLASQLANYGHKLSAEEHENVCTILLNLRALVMGAIDTGDNAAELAAHPKRAGLVNAMAQLCEDADL